MLYRRQTSDNFASPQQNLTAYYQSETRQGITLLHQRKTLYHQAIPSPNIAKPDFALPLHAVTILSNTHAKPSRTIPYQRIAKLDITEAKQIIAVPYRYLDNAKRDITIARHNRTKPMLYMTVLYLCQTMLNGTMARPCLALRHNTIAERDTAQQYHCYTLRRTTRPACTIPSPN